MCRMFGFKSVIPSQVHKSLVHADNALGFQSKEHPDGWGVVHYIDGAPHLIRSSETAKDDKLFHRVSGVVASETVVAHVRQATQGTPSVLNCHPFQYGRWTFAHNGDVPNFDEKREALLATINPHLRRFILGDTDSEVIFHMFVSELSRYGPLTRRLAIENVMDSLRDTMRKVREICDDPAAEKKSLLTAIATNGTTMVATRGGKELFWSTYKNQCADRDVCSYFAPECEAPSETGFINHMLVSSEPLSGENVWVEFDEGETVGVDWRMEFIRQDQAGQTISSTPLSPEQLVSLPGRAESN
jgi:predicted glutamine amidotransferase